jgi:uncharacterized repeat protein (TIGR03803 family)
MIAPSQASGLGGRGPNACIRTRHVLAQRFHSAPSPKLWHNIQPEGAYAEQRTAKESCNPPTNAHARFLACDMFRRDAHAAKPRSGADRLSDNLQLHRNTGWRSPNGALTVDKNGVLYGTTYSGGANGLGCIFSLTPVAGGAWQEAVLYSFSGPDGAYPLSTLTPGHSGEFYGTTSSGGGGAGTVFELSPPTVPGGAWTEQVLYSFSSSSRNPQNVSPNGNVILDSNGSLYVTMQGSPTRSGTALGLVIALTPPNSGSGSWIEHELFGFGPDVGWAGGAMPLAGVVSLNGSLFGTTYTEGDSSCGTTGCGAVYQLTPPAQAGAEWTETTLHTFSGYPADGAESYAPLTVGPGGVLFGTTFYGGAYSQTCQANGVDVGCGAVFELTPPTSPGVAGRNRLFTASPESSSS